MLNTVLTVVLADVVSNLSTDNGVVGLGSVMANLDGPRGR